jgi:ParB family transcriptional regulator, chromosome partitioning protein
LENLLSLGQAKAIAGVADHAQQVALAKNAIRAGGSVRQVEVAVRNLTMPGAAAGVGGGDGQGEGDNGNLKGRLGTKAAHLADLEQQIAQQLGTKVHLRSGRKKGTGSIAIDFYSLDQFDALLARLGVRME